MAVKLVVAFTVILTILTGCDRDEVPNGRGETQEIHGLLTDVNARSLLEVESFQVRDDQGTVWRFQVGASGFAAGGHDFTPSHLREHMVQGVRIKVSFIERDGVMAVLSIRE